MTDYEYKEEALDSDDVPEREVLDEVVVEKQPVKVNKTPKKAASKIASLPKKTVLTKVRRIASITLHEIVVVEDANGKGFIAPGSTIFVRGEAELDVSVLEEAYDWQEEIEEMLPDRDAMVHQIRRSIWVSGGFKKGAGRKPRRLDQAWPYRITEE